MFKYIQGLPAAAKNNNNEAQGHNSDSINVKPDKK